MHREYKPQIDLFIALLILLGGTAVVLTVRHNTSHRQVSAPTSGSPKAAPHRLAHIFVIVEENKPYSDFIGNQAAPYINSLVAHYGLATNYHSVASPSLPNYLALTSGSTHGVTDDCNPPAGCKLSVRNLADELEGAGVTWKEYAEDMPSACYAENSGQYATKHVPFLYYSDILDNPSRCQGHLLPFTQLSSDLSTTQQAPGFAFISPDLCNDGHNCPLSTADAWLSRNVSEILGSPAFTKQPSLLVITWDEADSGDTHVPAIMVGSGAKVGYRSDTPYDHYSLLKTVEQNWNLAPLSSADAQAAPMTSFIP